MNLATQAAADAHLTDSLDPFEAIEDVLLGEHAQLTRIHVIGGDSEKHDRELGDVELEDRRRLDVVRQRPSPPVQARAHLVSSNVDVSAEDELNPD